MSKKKILKGIDQQIFNLYCAMVDNDLDPSIPKEVVKEYKEKVLALRELRNKLEILL